MRSETSADVNVRMLIDVLGTFHGLDGVKRGDIVTLPAMDAIRYEHFGYCEPVNAADETPQMRKARIDHTTDAVQHWMADRAAHVQASLAGQHRTLDCGTGLPKAAR